MPNNVVYILGAGFSAPLGLPVMSTFFTRSKDLYAEDPVRFAHFAPVFDAIRQMSQAKNYLDLDLFNIEEILSILAMEDHTTGTNHRDAFTRYLADTITALTPEATPRAKHPGNWEDFLFTDHDTVRRYCTWLAGLFGLSIRATEVRDIFSWAEDPDPESEFGIISLNYDMVLERCLELINRQVAPKGELRFRGTVDGTGLPLAKIHGSVDPLTIVPPTWQKAASPEVADAWTLAAHLLAEANEIRVLGFSFPATDAYVKYLLSIGAMRAPHLKKIDVICWDPTGLVATGYRRFVTFREFRFRSADLVYYIGDYGNRTDERVTGQWHGFRRVRFRGINDHHEREMSRGDA